MQINYLIRQIRGELCFSVFFVLIFIISTAAHVGAEKPDKCKEMKTTEVEEKEFVQKTTKYIELKDALIKTALLNAVKQTLGTEVRSNVGMASTQLNDSVTDKFSELSVEKARGHVEGYEILNEDIEEKGTVSFLKIKLRVTVCVPDKESVTEVVAFGNFSNQKDKNNDVLRSMMRSHFPDNDTFSVSSENADDTFHDIKVSGKVLSFSSTLVNNSSAVGAQLLGSLFGGALGSAVGNSVEQQVKQGNAIVAIHISRVLDQETVSETADLSEEFPSTSTEEVIVSTLLNKAIRQATVGAYNKFITQYGRSKTGISKASLDFKGSNDIKESSKDSKVEDEVDLFPENE